MQRLMGIQEDKQVVDILEKVWAQSEMANQFAEGHDGLAATISPLRIYWESTHHAWNLPLAAAFAEHFIADKPEYANQADEVADRFLSRVDHLRRIVAAAEPRPGEDSDDAQERNQARILQKDHSRRVQTRKQTVHFIVSMFREKY